MSWRRCFDGGRMSESYFWISVDFIDISDDAQWSLFEDKGKRLRAVLITILRQQLQVDPFEKYAADCKMDYKFESVNWP
jgi:hypothetical protein